MRIQKLMFWKFFLSFVYANNFLHLFLEIYIFFKVSNHKQNANKNWAE